MVAMQHFAPFLPQALLATAILTASVGSFVALSPPNSRVAGSSAGSGQINDPFRAIGLTHPHASKVVLAPFGLMTAYTACLIISYPNVPMCLLRYGEENELNTGLITWSAATAIPLVLILFAGVPLRLIPYGSLGKNFTFAITEPDQLTTTGIYRYVQHPSYCGAFILLFANATLFMRVDGAIGCLIPSTWYRPARTILWTTAAVCTVIMGFSMWSRVRQEEAVLRSKFGPKWEAWHAKTARFIPWVF